MYEQVLQQVQKHLSELSRAQEQTASGFRNTRISDDPVAGAQVLRADRTLRAVSQYRRAVSAVRTRQDTAEAALDQVTDIMTRAKELGTGQAGSTANGQTRAAAAAEVDQLLQQAISLGNSRVGNEFIFGGTATGVPPFQANGTYVGTAASRQTEVASGQVVEMVPTGQALFVDTGVITTLTNLRDRLLANDDAGIMTSLGEVDTSMDGVQSRLAEVGSRSRSLDAAGTELDGLEDAATKGRSDAADIPLEESSTTLAAAQTALQAAILSGTKLLQSNLLTQYQ
jgi:flagellar hook-associated protein 3 FlgL